MARHNSTETKDDDDDDSDDDFLFSNFLVNAFDPRVLRAAGGGGEDGIGGEWVVGTVSGEGTGLQRFSGAIERV